MERTDEQDSDCLRLQEELGKCLFFTFRLTVFLERAVRFCSCMYSNQSARQQNSTRFVLSGCIRAANTLNKYISPVLGCYFYPWFFSSLCFLNERHRWVKDERHLWRMLHLNFPFISDAGRFFRIAFFLLIVILWNFSRTVCSVWDSHCFWGTYRTASLCRRVLIVLSDAASKGWCVYVEWHSATQTVQAHQHSALPFRSLLMISEGNFLCLRHFHRTRKGTPQEIPLFSY